ncbi:metal-dependent hydrolase family protein [Kordiimonas marina]|uniref:metal-dependent hydrolase family protein n=1 Tax=Kordiimonas marina TaxID=2872312 RepID=UPI001FF564B4|nr:amidohydrolase family protein [Kordiimonas marina]MCJ9429713.1 amidohydrolase family protein [Kordiimonas marina]
MSVIKMITKNLAVAAVGAMATASVAFAGQITVIHAGQLLEVPGKAPLKEQTLIIEDGHVKAVRKGYVPASEIDPKAKEVDFKDGFVMPGLMDMHVHLLGQLGPKNDYERLHYSNALYGMQGVMFAKRTLMAGFTTVRDLGDEPEHIFALRDASAKGWIPAPRIIAAGSPLSATGGHGDVDGMRPDFMHLITPKTVCDGADSCLHAVRYAVKYGADVIKIMATGGVLSDTSTGTGQQMTDAEMKTICDEAHSLGRKVAAHAHSAGGINAALRAGVDSIEHGSYADAESIKLFKKTGAYLVPTLLAGDTVVHMAKTSNFMPKDIKAKAIRVGGDMLKHFTADYKAGVKIAFGTDSGVSHHGMNAEEAILMNKAGMTPMDVLKSATVNAADLAGMSDKLGTLEPGKIADVVAMHGSPLKDLHELLDVDFVMKDGKIYKKK